MTRNLTLPQRQELQQKIVDLLRQRGNRLLSIADIQQRLAEPDLTTDQVARAVEELESEGIVIPVRGKRYSLLEFTPYHAGRIKIHGDGFGTVFGGGGDPDIYIDRRSLRGAMNGDLVVVRTDRRKPKYRKVRGRDLVVGDVSQVLRRAHSTVVGRFHAGDGMPFVVPFDFRIDTDIAIDSVEDTMGARDGETDQAPPKGHRLVAVHGHARHAAGVHQETDPLRTVSAVCDGTLTGNSMARLAPRALHASTARVTAAAEPAITTWPGALKFATQTSASARLHATST